MCAQPGVTAQAMAFQNLIESASWHCVPAINYFFTHWGIVKLSVLSTSSYEKKPLIINLLPKSNVHAHYEDELHNVTNHFNVYNGEVTHEGPHSLTTFSIVFQPV